MLTYLRIRLTARMNDRGASAVEYALMVAGIAVLCILAIKTLGLTLGAVFKAEDSRIGTPG